MENIRGLHLNFVECESFLKSNSHDILILCETSLDDSIDSGNFSMTDYLPIVQNNSITHICIALQFKRRRTSFCTGLSLENPTDSYLCFWLPLLNSLSYVSVLYQPLSSTLCTVFYSISSRLLGIKKQTCGALHA